MAENQWLATVTVTRPSTTTEQALDQLTQALPGFGIIFDDGHRMHLEMTVEAGTLRQATDTTLRAVREAYTAAFPGAPVRPLQLRVLTVEDWEAEVAHPAEAELVGLVEAGKILRISHQRVDQLARENPDFPQPLAVLAQGRVWTKDSVEAFGRRRPRRPGRPAKRR